MRLTPAQLAMSLMVHESLWHMRYASWAEGIARARQQLKEITGQDYAYDLRAWHQYLTETNAGGYKWGNGHRRFTQEIETAMSDETWQQAAATATAESLLERLVERDERQREAIELADREWSGKRRRCPKCSTEFVSMRDRGQCPHCGDVFYASHPDVGRKMWWLEVE